MTSQERIHPAARGPFPHSHDCNLRVSDWTPLLKPFHFVAAQVAMVAEAEWNATLAMAVFGHYSWNKSDVTDEQRLRFFENCMGRAAGCLNAGRAMGFYDPNSSPSMVENMWAKLHTIGTLAKMKSWPTYSETVAELARG